ncbi:MAG TPA: hypothetical protein DEB40_11430 [Elusimicrobia bacterium]|nr:hypothetical protein [Elusimicrobiota bacterium]HBT62344.1 hypothetical protein [Elusimicrobiota bacterium]
MHLIIALWLLALPARSSAQDSGGAELGYVVRVLDTGTVVLDFNEKSGASVGRPFTLFKEGDELKHPVTGKSLGRIESAVAQGILTQILPLYSIGALSSAGPSETVVPGMRARLNPAPAQTPAPAQPAATQSSSRPPRWRSPSFDYQATAMSVADCRGDGQLQTVLSDGRNVYLYSYPPNGATPIVQFAHKGNAPRILSLEAADINGNGRCEIFASLHNDTFNRFETVVLEFDGQGRLAQIAEFPYLVRSYLDPEGKPRFAVQQIVEDKSFPFGTIYPLSWKDGKYGPGRPPIGFGKRGVDWLYDFNFLSIDGKTATVSLTNTELVRVIFPNGKNVKTDAPYGQTPNRVRWTGDRMLNFRPPMAARYDNKGSLAGFYLLKNIAAFGGLAAPFGVFARGELHRKDWNGLSFSNSWVAELGGYSTGLALVSPPNGAQELAVAVVGTAGKTSVWAFDP